MGSTASNITSIYKAHDNGCACRKYTGYKGRIGIYEVLNNSPAIQSLLVGDTTSEKLNDAAIKKNMPMQMDSLIKAVAAKLTIEEILGSPPRRNNMLHL